MAQPDRAVSSRRGWISRGRVVVILAALVASEVAIFHRPLFRGNFGVVSPGLVYRAAQPSADDWPRLFGAYHLASVLNLRGGSDGDPWYVAEVRATRERGVPFYDLPLSATRRPTRRELLILLDLFGRCRYPLLIHCKSGSDRTGMASALYLMAVHNVPPDEAINAFSLSYGHVPLTGTKHLHEPFLEYAAWLKARGLTHTPARLRHWIEHDYRSDDPSITVRPIASGPRPHAIDSPTRK